MPGQTYTFAVVATNSVGPSSPSATPSVTDLDVPQPPVSVTSTSTSSSVTATWTAPTDDGGSPILGYTAQAFDATSDAVLASCGVAAAITSCVMTGISPNKSYYVRVVAVNAQGSSDPSLATPVDKTGPAVPGSPTPSSLTAGDKSATVSWTAPSFDGGSAISSYTATADDGSGDTFTCATNGAARSCQISGLTNGVSYAVTLTATNVAGNSLVVSAGTVVPATVPDSPSSLVVISGPSSLAVSWSAPASDGGYDIEGYTATATDLAGDVFSCRSVMTSCVISGLTNGVSYAITVVATTMVGDSLAEIGGTYSPSDVSSAPQGLSLISANGSLTASWSAPVNDGGLAIESYTMTAIDGDGNSFTCSTSSTSCTITGLTNGVPYTVSVVATNADGNSPATILGLGTPLTMPSAPNAPRAIALSGSADVTWTSALTDGGSAIISYTATATDANGNQLSCVADAASTSCRITGLTNGVSYDITVVATNAVGSSVVAEAGFVIPSDVPTAPIAGTLESGNSAVTVTWAAPLDDGGLAITSYTATATDESGATFTCSTTTTSCEISGLTNGVSYTVTVVATNATGDSAATLVGNATPATTPVAPTVVSVVAASQSATVTWTLSADDGGSPISRYTATATDGTGNSFSCVSGANDTSCVIYGLTNGVTYEISVVATNPVGDSAASTSVTVTPQASPGAPSNVSATLTGSTVSVSWSLSTDDGGSPITGYIATATFDNGSLSCTAGPSDTSCTIFGLTVGYTYSITVVAVNAVGQSGVASADTTVSDFSVPSSPTGVWTSSLDGGLQIYWNAPSSNGGSEITNYHVTVTDPSGDVAGSCDTLDTTCTVTGLTNWVTYSVAVTAQNAIGSSASLTTIPTGGSAQDIRSYKSGWLALTTSSVEESSPYFDLTTINNILSDGCNASSLAVAPDGTFWVTTYCGAYYHVALDGSVSSFGNGNAMYYIVVAPNGDVLGTRFDNQISILDPQTNSWSSQSVSGADCLAEMTYTPDGSLYVADPCTSQVSRVNGDLFDPSAAIDVTSNPQYFVGGVYGLASGDDGTLWAGNFSGQVASVNPVTGEVDYQVAPLPCSWRLALIDGVVVTADACYQQFGIDLSATSTGQPQGQVSSAPQNVIVQTGSHHIVVTWSASQFNGTAGPTTSYTATATDASGNHVSCTQPVFYACVISGLTDGVAYDVTVVANNAAGSSSPYDAGLFMPVTASVTVPTDYRSVSPNNYVVLSTLSASGSSPTVSNLPAGATVFVSTSTGVLMLSDTNGLVSIPRYSFTDGTTLAFMGSTDAVNAALASLALAQQQVGSFTITLTVVDAGFAYDPVSGHAFLQEACNSCTFTDALAGAREFSLNGVEGYLLNDATSSANDVLSRYMSQSSWGGFTDYQPYMLDSSGNPIYAYEYANNDISTSFSSASYVSDPQASFQKWTYVSGPNAGQIMTLGGVRTGNCQAQPSTAQNGFFANWNNGEPNDCASSEFVPQLGAFGGGWNDVGITATLGYSVIEFGGLATDNGPVSIAHSASGSGIVSSPPTTPGNVTAYTVNQSIVVSIGTPSGGGSSPVAYTYLASPTGWGNTDGDVCVTTALTCTLDSLAWGQAYYVTVYATNVAGNSSWAYVGYYAIALEMQATIDGNSSVMTVTSHDSSLTSAWVNARSAGPTLRWCDFQNLEVGVPQSCPIHGLNYSTSYQLTVDTYTPTGAHVFAVASIVTGNYTPVYGLTPPVNVLTSWTDTAQTATVDANNNIWRLSGLTSVEIDSSTGSPLNSVDFGSLIPSGAYGARIAALPQGGVVVALNGYGATGWMSLGAVVITAQGDATYVDGNASTVGQIAVDPVTGNVAIDSGSGLALLDTTNLTWSNVFPGTGSVDSRYASVAFDSSGNLWFTGNSNTTSFYEVTNPFGDASLSKVTSPVAFSYRDQVMVSVAGVFYILNADDTLTAWNPTTNATSVIDLYNEFPESAQWWGLFVPGVAGVVDNSIAFSVAEYGWDGGPGVAIFEMPLPLCPSGSSLRG